MQYFSVDVLSIEIYACHSATRLHQLRAALFATCVTFLSSPAISNKLPFILYELLQRVVLAHDLHKKERAGALSLSLSLSASNVHLCRQPRELASRLSATRFFSFRMPGRARS
jgi:hypothetical protein